MQAQGEKPAPLGASQEEPKSHNWQLPVTLACILLGIMVSLQYRTTRLVQTPQTGERAQLIELVKKLESERNKMSSELTDARARLAEIEQALGRGESLHREMVAQHKTAQVEAGLAAMKGPGVIVRMTDSPRTPGAQDDPYFYIVHDVDIQALVNELWAAGAEAIAVNDQRIVTRSSIRCVGPTILVNANRMAAPYVIKAIGPQADMEGGLRMPGGFIDSMSPLMSNGGEVTVSRLQEVVVPAYQGSLAFRYAKPFEDDLATSSQETGN